MTRLKLVSPDEPTALERLLLNASASERPSLEQQMRVRRALGLPAVPSYLPRALGGRWSISGKALVYSLGSVGAIAALLFTRDAPLSAERVAELRTAPVASVVEAKPAAVPAPAPQAAAATPSAVALADVPVAQEAAAPPAAKSRSVSRSGSNPPASDLFEQIRLIEQARAAARRGDSVVVLRSLDAYNGKFPRGSFGQEAAVLRMEALAQRGERGRAASLARRFISRYPSSTHTDRVERLSERLEQ